MPECKYERCNREVNPPHDKEYCVYHSIPEKKGIDCNEFNDLIFFQLLNGDCNFEGYIFPGNISFKGSKFINYTSFRDAKFYGNVKNSPNDFCAEFSNAEFVKGADFSNTIFLNGTVTFQMTAFESGNVDFNDTEFSGGAVIFLRTEFKNNSVGFLSTKFKGGRAYFIGVKFSNSIMFNKIAIYYPITFADIVFSNATSFYFLNPIFVIPKFEERMHDRNIITLFSNIRFNQFLSFFDGIDTDVFSADVSQPPVLCFRNCNLKDVYFAKNNMSIMSFYKSAFDEARFDSNSWENERKTIFGRRKLICEEILYNYLSQNLSDQIKKEEFKKKYELEDLNGYDEISNLYRNFKATLDKCKNYTESGWFYFNEFEMKRRALKEEFAGKGWLASMREWGYYLLYSLYKIFMGYGEKPLWSFLWVVLFSLLFSWYYLFAGLIISKDRIINYDWARTCPDIWSFIIDCLYSFLFTITRILPQNYLPSQWRDMVSTGWGGGAVTFMNTIIIGLLTVFIGIGLKRHFRRF